MKRISYKLSAAVLLSVLALFSSGYAYAGQKVVKQKKDSTAKVTKNPYEKLLGKPHRKAAGMITLHLAGGSLYFELPKSVLGREMVMGSTIKAISDNANGVVGAKPSELVHFKFDLVDSTVRMLSVSTDYMSDDKNIRAALDKSNIGAVLKSFPVKAYSPDSSAVVVDVTSVFLDHDKKMSPFSEYAANAQYKRDESYKRDKSFIQDIKSFEDNVSVTSNMSFTYTMTDLKGKEIVKDEPFTAVMTRSIVMLPEQVYHPRMADYRIGVFYTQRTKLADGHSSSDPVFFANRWRLEPSDTAAYRRGELVEPVKPIVFYIDKDFPDWWRPYIKEGVEQWQELFETIGFKNAIQAKDFPDNDPEFDPDNIKYNCIRYAPIGIENAMGPSWVDPRSGEIINAAVYVYHDIVKLLTNWMFVQTAAADEDVRVKTLPQDKLGDALRYVISHEVGHCLGFMHNMSGSSVIPVDSLRSPSFTSKYGTTTSIMDYARFNYVAQRGDKERGVKLTPPRFGSYDRWLVRWTYTPVFDAPDFETEARITSGWITDSLKSAPFYRYGKQQMSSTLYDPRSQNEDLGDDAVKASRYGVENLKYIVANYYSWIPDDQDPDLDFRISIYNSILSQLLNYARHVTLNVGGLYKNEVKASDTMPRYENIPYSRQKESLDYLSELSRDLSWLAPKDLMDKLPAVGTPCYSVAEALQQYILMTPFLASMSDGVATKEYSFRQCMDDVYDMVWNVKSKNLTPEQRLFQKQFVDNLMASAGFRKPAGNEEAVQDVTNSCFGEGDDSCLSGTLSYNPVSGYEWIPRYIFNRGEATSGDIYAYLTKAKDLMLKRRKSASDIDKAHYDMLIETISYGLDK